MKPTSKYFDSIRINPDGKKKKKRVEESTAQNCQWAGCEKPGTHKAPAGRDREGQYLHFCIDHVREYNKNYNYFSGLGDDEIARLHDAMLAIIDQHVEFERPLDDIGKSADRPNNVHHGIGFSCPGLVRYDLCRHSKTRQVTILSWDGL